MAYIGAGGALTNFLTILYTCSDEFTRNIYIVDLIWVKLTEHYGLLVHLSLQQAPYVLGNTREKCFLLCCSGMTQGSRYVI